MKLILTCSSTNEDYNGGCDYALVDLDKDAARELLALIDRFRDIEKSDPSLNEMHYFERQTIFFSPYPDHNSAAGNFKESVKDLLWESLEKILDGETWAEAPADFEVPDACIASTECDQTVIKHEGVYFFCYPRHSNAMITTDIVPVEMLLKVTMGYAA